MVHPLGVIVRLLRRVPVRLWVVGALIAGMVGVCLLYAFNPEEGGLFPKCPFYVLTGLQCPGCGTTRAIHCLLHFEFLKAWQYNPLMVASIPLLIGLLLSPKLCRNVVVSYTILGVVITYWIVRNIV